MLLSDENSNLQVVFKQKEFIGDVTKRFDYLLSILNTTPSVKIFDENYRSFSLMGPGVNKAAHVYFDIDDFSDKNLVKLIHDDQSYFLKVKNLIIKNLKENIIRKQFDDIKDNLSVLGFIDDIEIDIELKQSKLKDEIKNDTILNNIYGSETFSNGMLLLKIKTKLKSNGILSRNSIDKIIALNIDYN